jgi:AcrR family transcriptional regulator
VPPRPGLTPDRIVEVAAELIDRDGYAQLGLGKVAAELGVRTPSLYNHIDGLDELRRRLTVRALTVLGAQLQRAAVGLTAEDAVRAIAGAYRRFAREHPGLYATTVPSIEGADAEVQRVGAEVMGTVLAALSGFGLDDDAAIHAARSLRSAVHGFVSLELAGGFGIPVDIDASFAWLTDLLAEGIRGRTEDV